MKKLISPIPAFIILFLFFMNSCSLDKVDPLVLPDFGVGFTTESISNNGYAPVTIIFNYTTSQTGFTYLWGFGDGETSTTNNPSHVYNEPGLYKVELTVTHTATQESKIFTQEVDIKKLDFGEGFTIESISNNGYAPATVQFNYTTTTTGLTYLWDFDDGETSTTNNPSHEYNKLGIYNVKLTVTHTAPQESKIFTQEVEIKVITFNKIIPNSSRKKPIQILQNTDGTYVILTQNYDTRGIELFFLNEEGETQKTIHINPTTTGLTGYDWLGCNEIIKTDSGYAIVGSCLNEMFQDVFLILTDKQGNLLNNIPKIYKQLIDPDGSSIIKTDDGYALFGTEFKAGGAPFGLHLTLTHENGNEKNDSPKTYSSENGNLRGDIITRTTDNDLVMIGNHWNNENNRDIYFVLTDKNGIEKANSPQLLKYGSPLGVVSTDSGFALYYESNDKMFLVFTDKYGKAITASQEYEGLGHTRHSITKTSDNGFALIGYYDQSDDDICLILTDAQGNETYGSPLFYGSTDNEQGYSVIQTQDGGLALLGLRGNLQPAGGSSNLIFIKTDNKGTVE